MAEYIEREAAFNAVLKLVPKVDDDGYCWVIRGDVARAIDTIPAADVRPVVRGKWTMEHLASTSGGTYAVVRCSECKAQYPIWPTNFCPNCGADMRNAND